MSWSLDLLQGDQAFEALLDPQLQRDWRILARSDPKSARSDPKSTWFEEPTFVLAWYTAYRKTAVPLVAIASGPSGLVGVMALATDADSSEIVHAGAHQANYHGWIAAPDAEGRFPAACVDAVFGRFRPRRWLWKHLPPGAPIDWVETLRRRSGPGAVRHETLQSPIWDLTDTAVEQRLWKGSLKNYFNRYRREGQLVYERLSEPHRLKDAVAQLIPWCDLRHGAVHGDLPFWEDAAKAPFHEALANAGDQIYASQLRLDERPLAIHLGPVDDRQLYLGIHGYDPAEGKRSPGTILFIEMARHLASIGVRTLDLTPGGDAFKERFATGHREIHQLEFYRSSTELSVGRVAQSVGRGARALIRRIGLQPAEFKRGIAEMTRRIGRSSPRTESRPPDAIVVELDVGATRMPTKSEPRSLVSPPSAVADLVVFAAANDRAASRQFFRVCLARLQQGWRPYLYRTIDRLVLLAWVPSPATTVLLPTPERPEPTLRGGNTAGEQESRVPEDTLFIWLDREDAPASPLEPGCFLEAIARDHEGIRRLWVMVASNQPISRLWLSRHGCPLETPLSASR